MTCPSCQATIQDDAAFCPSCGRQQSQPAPQPAAAAASTGAFQPQAGQAQTWDEADRAPFQYGGTWWAKGSASEVLRYDGERGWTNPPSHDTPFFMRRPKFTSLKTPAIWLYVLFGFYILASLIFLPAVAQRATLFDDIDSSSRLNRDLLDRIDASDAYYTLAAGLQGLAILLIIPFFIWFTRRATCNARSLGARDPDFSPGWAIGWWFVPIANFVQPFRVLSESWRAADEGAPLAESDHFRRAGVPRLLLAWWLAFQVGGLALNITQFVAESEETSLSTAANAFRAGLLLETIVIGAAVLAVLVVRAMTRRHDLANVRFNLRSGLTAVPGSEFAAGPAYTTLQGSEPRQKGW